MTSMHADHPATVQIEHGRMRRGDRRVGFTLTELLVVIAIIAILGAATVISFQSVSRDARMSSAQNAVMAALDQARGLAMKTNNYTMVVFRPRLSDDGKQVTEIVTTQWTKVASGPCVIFATAPIRRPVDRHRIAPGIPVRTLPAGVSIAAPTYGYAPADSGNWTDVEIDTFDKQWFTLSNFKNDFVNVEAPGHLIGVLYSPEGTVVSRNVHVDSYRQYVDFNDNAIQETIGDSGFPQSFPHDGLMQVSCQSGEQMTSEVFNEFGFYHQEDGPEPFVLVSPFIVVFDDADARELATSPQDWGDIDARRAYFSEYIDEYGRRIHFNRYSGVVVR